MKTCLFKMALITFSISTIITCTLISAFAEESNNASSDTSVVSVESTNPTSSGEPDSGTENVNTLKYYIGESVNAGLDTGYTQTDTITINDIHYGWKIGQFCISGYTRVTENDSPVFLKNVGDKVTLWFTLNQDIDKLNNNDTLSINEDENGYDECFGIQKTNFGKGALIIKHTDYQNISAEPVIYTNYLSSDLTNNVETEVELFEEGDYEVALDYEIKSNPNNILGVDILPSYSDYKIFFKFSVRNGNCMVYPFDVKTNGELTNTSVTDNGFYLDLAKSRYLDINVKKEILKDGAEGLTEDTRFNKPAKDGDKYTEEGIYTITAINKYTEQQTVKKIYVGTDNLLKAYVTTGLPISQIKEQIKLGATISDDGTIIQPTNGNVDGNENDKNNQDSSNDNLTNDIPEKENTQHSPLPLIAVIVSIIAAVIVIVSLSVMKKQKNAKSKKESNNNENKTGDDYKEEENKTEYGDKEGENK